MQSEWERPAPLGRATAFQEPRAAQTRGGATARSQLRKNRRRKAQLTVKQIEGDFDVLELKEDGKVAESWNIGSATRFPFDLCVAVLTRRPPAWLHCSN